MKVLGSLCQCNLCHHKSPENAGFWYPCGCPITETNYIHHPHDVQGVQVGGQVYPIDRVVHTGGRWATWIYLEDGEFAEMLTKKQVGSEITEINGQPVEVVARFPASVHGCHKLSMHQELVVVKRKMLSIK
jgi:hypothetical protein